MSANFVTRLVSLLPQSFRDSDAFNGAYKCYKAFRMRHVLTSVARNYDLVSKNFDKSTKIRLGVYVDSDAMFGGKTLVNLANNDVNFATVRFVIVPNTLKTPAQSRALYDATKAFFTKNYGAEAVLDGYDWAKNEPLEQSANFDAIYLVSPYSAGKYYVHTAEFLSTRALLPFHIQYAFSHFKYGDHTIAGQPSLGLCWRVFVNNHFEYDGFKNFNIASGKNVQITGYAKMDDFANISRKPAQNGRKTIIIAPHHSIKSTMLEISNFLYYSDLLLELPAKFPQVDFIFRPHPHLFANLVNTGFWTQEKVDEYIRKISEIMKFSNGGDYLEIFANSDGIVHDCGSFMSEWLFNGKRGCFVSYDGKIFPQLAKFGDEVIKFYDIAKCDEDVISYIKSVVDGTLAPLDASVIKKDIMINYPNVSREILLRIKQTLKG